MNAPVLAVLLLLGSASTPAAPTTTAPTATAPTTTAPTTAPTTTAPTTTAPTTTAPTTTAPTTATRKLEESRAALARLDCDRVVDLASRVEDHRLATDAERREAAFQHAYCAVVLGDNDGAQDIFAAVVAEDIDAAPPFEMEPRVLVLLEAARSAERQRRASDAAKKREERRAQVELSVARPVDVHGGARAFFPVTLRDPPGMVRSVRLEFRRAGEVDFYALPVTKQGDGSLRGEIPGTYTRSLTGLRIEWFVAAIGHDGAVVQRVGSPEAPEVLVVAPGSTLAEDLRANERLSFATRMTLALLATPMSTGVGGAGMILAVLLSVEPGEPLARWVRPALAMLPGLGATAGTWLVAQSILDGPEVAIATLTSAGFSVLWALGILATSTFPFQSDANEQPGADAWLALSTASAVLGFVAAGVVPATLVLLDPAGD
jgi:hypothetical protein